MLYQLELLSTGMISEQYEGVRVELLGATCTMTPNEYGEWEVNDGSGPLLIDDRLATPMLKFIKDLFMMLLVLLIVIIHLNFKLQKLILKKVKIFLQLQLLVMICL